MNFNTIPGNIVAPIMAFEINSGGLFENQSRLLLIGFETSAGAMPLNTATPCPTLAEASRLAGAGSMLYEMVRNARANAPAQEIWIAAPAAVGVAETRTLTISAPPAAGGVGLLDIDGQRVTVSLAAGDTAASAAAKIAAAINAFYSPQNGAYLPFTATSASAVVTLTARHVGLHGADHDIFVPTIAGNALTGIVVVAVGTAGTGSPDLSALLAALGDDQFDWIVTAFGDDANLLRYDALLSDVSGRWAWNKQIYGHVFYARRGSIATLTTHSLARDTRHSTLIAIPAAGVPSHPSGYLAALVASIVTWLGDGTGGNAARNQTGIVVEGLQAPRARADWPDYATRQAMLVSGISTWSVNTAGQVMIDKIITQQRTTAGAPDVTFRDIQAIAVLVVAMRNFRADLAFGHSQKSLKDDNPVGAGTVSTPRDIAATIIQTYRRLETQGLLENTALASEQLQVQRNAQNPNRVDVMLRIDRANPLDVLAANAILYSQL